MTISIIQTENNNNWEWKHFCLNFFIKIWLKKETQQNIKVLKWYNFVVLLCFSSTKVNYKKSGNFTSYNMKNFSRTEGNFTYQAENYQNANTLRKLQIKDQNNIWKAIGYFAYKVITFFSFKWIELLYYSQ